MIVSDHRLNDTTWVLSNLLAALRRRRYILLLSTAAGLAAGLAGYLNAPQSYSSEVVLALDVRRVQALPTETVVSPLPQDSPVLKTELDLIQSRLMATKVIERLHEENVAILEEEPRRSLPAAVLAAMIEPLQAIANPRTTSAPRHTPGSERAKIDQLLTNLQVSNDGRSYTIYISFRASDPIYAAQVANAYAHSYLDHQIAVQRSATRRVSDWLGETLISLRADLEASERAAEEFRQEAGLVETDGATLQTQRVSALNAELVAARAAVAEAKARMEVVKALAEGTDVPPSADFLGSTAIQTLRADQARLERKIDELRGSGALKSTQLNILGAELAAIGEQIAREVQRVLASLDSEIAIARRKEERLEAELAHAQSEFAKASHAEVTMAQLEREANANGTIYESYLVRYKQTIEQDGIAAPEAQIISLAEPAMARSSPRFSTWLLFGLGLGGGIGVAGAAFREATDHRPRLPELLRQATDTPVIGLLPHLTRSEQKRIAEDAQNASARFGRAVHTLRSALRLSPAAAPTAIAVTSAFAGDGKTTLALGLGRSAVAAGVKTVIVDADLRDPAIEKASGISTTAYIDEILDQTRSVHRMLTKDMMTDLQILPARVGVVAPERLFASGNFERLLIELKEHFDLVLIDTPDFDRAADAMSIATAADRVLFVVHCRAKRLQQVAAWVRNLAACGRKPDGIVLNQVDQNFYSDLAESSFRHMHPASGSPAEHAQRQS